ncbi:MAG: hypothetical protein K2X74_22745 [Acetobacteraceae bacterium]|nr:hypothetical protein [Acetobacteraceae bacterium]
MALETTVHNEQVKLTAAFLNLVGTGSAGFGVLAQLAQWGFNPDLRPGSWDLTAGVAIWIGIALYMHAVGRLVLKGLRE